MAFPETPFKAPFVDTKTGHVTQPWVEWLLLTKTNKLDLVDSAEASNVAVFTSTGNIEDGGYSVSELISLLTYDSSDDEAAAYYFASI